MITIDWPTGVISVPQSYLSNLGGGIYELDVDQFRLDLKDLEDDAEGISWPATHIHNTQVTLAGVTYARTVEIINGYTVEFENGTYTVKCVRSKPQHRRRKGSKQRVSSYWKLRWSDCSDVRLWCYYPRQRGYCFVGMGTDGGRPYNCRNNWERT
jgi:hypothetical protein